jgi:hypothetical protein
MYVEQPMVNVPKFHWGFCNCFWMPYALFVKFVSDAKENDWFPHWKKRNITSSIELLIFGGF